MAPKVVKPDTIHSDRSDIWKQHKPEYADMCPACKTVHQQAKNINALYTSLVEFGYSSLTKDEVKEAYEGALDGVDPGSDIIKMMVTRQMREAGLIP